MNELEKEAIANLILEFMAKRGLSQNKTADMVKVSNAYLSKMVNGLPTESRDKWNDINPSSWRKVKNEISQLTFAATTINGSWVMVEDIAPFVDLKKILLKAKEKSQTMGIVAPAGTGKTEVGKWCSEHENFFHIKCSVIQNLGTFMKLILKEMAIPTTDINNSDMMQMIEDRLKEKDHPILFLDEFDKVPEAVLKFFIDLYNRVEGSCSLVMGATDFLESRILKGRLKKKQGYEELWSRIGGEWMKISCADSYDIARIIRANGIDDEVVISTIINKAQGDLRKVRYQVFKRKEQQAELAA